MNYLAQLNRLCTPAYVYFVISMFFIFVSIVQNVGNNKKYSLGSFSCSVPNCSTVFIVKLVWIFFWTWVLNRICKDGHTNISWFLVLMPYIMGFVILGGLMVYQKKH